MKLLIAILAAATLAAGSTNLCASDFKLATIDLKKAFDTSPAGKAAEVKLNKKRLALRAELEALPSRAVQEASEKKEIELKEYAAQMRGEIVSKLLTALAQVQKERGYALVIDTSGTSLNGMPFVFVEEGAPDITEAVLAKVR